METKGNYYYLYDNVLFVTLNTGAYPGGNDEENAGKRQRTQRSLSENRGKSNRGQLPHHADMRQSGNMPASISGSIVTHHKSSQTVAKHAADSDIENYVDAGFEKVMARI